MVAAVGWSCVTPARRGLFGSRSTVPCWAEPASPIARHRAAHRGDTTVVLSSDHGCVELLPEGVAHVSKNEADKAGTTQSCMLVLDADGGRASGLECADGAFGSFGSGGYRQK
jgi:hypothetical protein